MRAVGRPRGAAHFGQHVAFVLAQRLEESAPFGVDGIGIAEIALVEFLDERRVGAEQKRCLLRSHGLNLLGLAGQPCIALSISSPSAAGESATMMPADRMASTLNSAVSWPPEITAPAWPMRRPGGAVRPAIKPTTGFLVFDALRNSAPL